MRDFRPARTSNDFVDKKLWRSLSLRGGLSRCSLHTLLYAEMNYVATLLRYKFSFMFQSKLPIRGNGEGGGGGEGEETRSVTEKRCSHNQLQSGHLARWSADNSFFFPKQIF